MTIIIIMIIMIIIMIVIAMFIILSIHVDLIEHDTRYGSLIAATDCEGSSKCTEITRWSVLGSTSCKYLLSYLFC